MLRVSHVQYSFESRIQSAGFGMDGFSMYVLLGFKGLSVKVRV
jgi:hypothetical protein